MLNRITHIHPSQSTKIQNPLLRELNLKAGDIFKGTVLQKFPQGEVFISAQGQQFRAYTGLNLNEKGEHHFQVRSLGTTIELKVLDGVISKSASPLQLWASGRVTRDQLSNILQTLSGTHTLKGLTPSSREALRGLSQLTPSIIFGDQGADTKMWVSRFLAGSGLFWESKVVRCLLGDKTTTWKALMSRDLKGTLLSLLKTLQAEKQDGEQLKKIVADVEQAIHLIEEDQILNLSSMREGLGWFWLIPGCLEDGFKKAELFIKEKKADDEIHFSMLIEFTHLGRMDLDVSIIKSVLTMKILAEDEQKARFITENLPLLEQALQGVGLSTGTIICDIKEEQDKATGPFALAEGPFVHIVI